MKEVLVGWGRDSDTSEWGGNIICPHLYISTNLPREQGLLWKVLKLCLFLRFQSTGATWNGVEGGRGKPESNWWQRRSLSHWKTDTESRGRHDCWDPASFCIPPRRAWFWRWACCFSLRLSRLLPAGTCMWIQMAWLLRIQVPQSCSKPTFPPSCLLPAILHWFVPRFHL